MLETKALPQELLGLIEKSTGAGAWQNPKDQLPPDGDIFIGTPFSMALRPLTLERRWVAWRWEKKKDGKETKVPIQTRHPFKLAKTDDPLTWGSWAQAKQVVNSNGTGFVLTDSQIAAFDIDNCRDSETGVIHPGQ